MRLQVLLLAFALGAITTAACTETSRLDVPERLRVSVLPDQSEDQQRSRFSGLIGYLSTETGMNVELVHASDYQNLLELFHAGEIDLARFGGYTFLKAHKHDEAEPLVMRDVDTRFTSYFIVANGNAARSFNDLYETNLAFGSKLSTSGHLMPRFFMLQRGLEPEKHFSEIFYTGAHDKTVRAVAEGRADVGVTNSIVLERMLVQGASAAKRVRVFWRTPPYANYVWAARPDLAKTARDAIFDAFLRLSDSNDNAHILRDVGARYYVPASERDFLSLRETALSLDLLE